MVGRITAAIGGPGAAIAESTVLATSVVAVSWVAAGGPVRPPPEVLLAVAPAIVDLVSLMLVFRLVLLLPGLLDALRHRHGVLLCAVAMLGVGTGNMLAGLRAAGAPIPAGAVGTAVLVGYLMAAALPLIAEIPPVPGWPAAGLRVLPYVLVGSAVLAVCGQAVVADTGPAPIGLAACAVAGLVVLQAFGLVDNAQLVEELETSRQRLTALLENTSDLIVRLDSNGRVLAANAAAVRLLHRTPGSLAGRSFDDLARAEDRRGVREAVLAVARGREISAQVELRLAAPAAGTAQLRLRAVPGGAVANLNDVTDSVELRQRLERLARYDQMTGLANRSHLLEVVGAWLSEPDAEVAVLYADLDGFKAVNDRFGHTAGDRVLREVAVRFEALAGALDARRVIVGRVGGDEFVVSLEGAGDDAAWSAAQQLVEVISPPFGVRDRTVQLGVSVGVAGAGAGHGHGVAAGAAGAAELVHRADLAMYAAKSGGRAQVGRWTPALEERARRRVDIAIGLRGALDKGRLAVAYQPIVRLSDGVVIGAEALLRLPRGVDPAALAPGLDALVSPAELVAVAEDTGTISEMGEWVLAQAAQQAAEWTAAGHAATVSVNMSVQQLVAPGFVDSVRAILRGCELPAASLVLELTESQLAGRAGPALQALQQLRAAGVRVAIDDFGTGYSSLSYLRHLPVQLVKIDRTLLNDVGVDPRATALARSVVSMARDLGLLVVAEGMEDLDAVRLLRDLGAYAGQGFALSPALPPEGMLAVLAGRPLDLGPRNHLPATGAVVLPLVRPSAPAPRDPLTEDRTSASRIVDVSDAGSSAPSIDR
jgi:diguanylate cyclase (GGDEF)-like protein/PAS domain S-box-containing protein